jgi:chromate reductase, NAD(P)H dehydrogenase (quinone)
MIKILALSGSLRFASSNTTILRTLATMSSPEIHISLYNGIKDIPLFNPDIENEKIASVDDFRTKIKESDGVIISCPEYARGVPGAFKNSLDWVVGTGDFMNKPVALLNASVMATHAQTSLKETVTVMGAKVIEQASLVVPLSGNNMNKDDIISNPETSNVLKKTLEVFVKAIIADKRRL